MNEFIISCCSTADLSREVLKENNIEYTCFHYNIDGKDCLDDLGETMPISEFYKKMSEGAEPTTSQVSVGQYTEFFEKFIKDIDTLSCKDLNKSFEIIQKLKSSKKKVLKNE